jgi:hypothetical protein
MKISNIGCFSCAAVLMAAATASNAQPAPVAVPLDTEQVVGGVGVGCTGVGQSKDDPRWKAYPIRVEVSNPAGDLLADVAISVSNASGGLLATISCEGPWIMLRPAPGLYKLEAWAPGQGLPHRTASFSPPARGQRIVELNFPEM